MESTLRDTRVTGVKTNLPLLRAIVADNVYRAGETTTRFLDDRSSFLQIESSGIPLDVKFLAAGALLAGERGWRLGGIGIPIDIVIDGTPLRTTAQRCGGRWRTAGELQPEFGVECRGNDVIVDIGERTIVGDVQIDAGGGRIVHNARTYGFVFAAPPDADAGRRGSPAVGSGNVSSPMPGKIVGVVVADGEAVTESALLVVLEAMKMEHRIVAPLTGTIARVHVKLGDIVAADAPLVTIAAPP
jgi:acetyl/propionyl-CoA carboxylase alpha subunit